MYPGDPFDELIKNRAERILAFLCRVSGKDNIFFAKITYVLTEVFLVVDTLKTGDLLWTLLWVHFIYKAPAYWEYMGKSRKMMEGGQAALPEPPSQFVMRYRSRFVAYGFAFLLFDIAFHSYTPYRYPGLILAGLTLYFMSDHRPKSKSKLRQAAKWFSRQAQKVREWLPRPAPAPFPV